MSCTLKSNLRGSRQRAVVAAIASLSLTLGCGGASSNMAPVKGKITLDGAPLKTGVVSTIPTAGRGAKGGINADGTFELGTNSENDGASVGLHKVAVLAFDKSAGQGAEAERGKPLVPDRYLSPESSGLTIDVKAGEENVVTLELTSP
jgi:hypothetical protein